MNTKIYTLLTKNGKRSSLKTILLSAVLLFSGASASYAIGTAPSFVHGTSQTMSVCQDAVPTQINSLLAVNDPNTGDVETWTVFSGPSNGTIVTGTTAVVTTGATTPTGFTYQPNAGFSGTDVFTIEVSDGSNTAMTTVTVTVNALPAVQTFTGGGGYCDGSAGVNIGLTLSESGVLYQLYESPSTAVGSPVSGTGGAVDFGVYATPGYYYAIASRGTCTSSLPGVTVHVNAHPDTFSLTGGGSYCSGGAGVEVGLNNSAIGVSYQLYEGVNPVGSPVSGTGGPISFGLQATVGSYTAKATNTSTLCESDMNGSATVDTFPLPTAYNVIGGGYYCLFGTQMPIMLDGSDAGVNYQLIYLGIIPLNSPVAGTGDTLTLSEEFLPGSYTVVATDTLTGCVSNMNGSTSVNFSIPPIPYTVTQTNGGHYCPGSGVTIGLSNSATGVDYQLYRNDTAVGTAVAGVGGALSFGTFTAQGTYRVVGTNTTSGCTTNMTGTSVVILDPMVAPTVHITSGIGTGSEVCYGALATFTAQTTHGGNTPTYEWKLNNISLPATDSTYTYLPVDGEVLSVVMHSSDLCASPETASHSITVNVDTEAAPSVFLDVTPTTSITPGTSVTINAIPTHGGLTPSYQWYKNGIIIPGATNSSYTSTGFVNHDSVSVIMVSSGGCGGVIAKNAVIISVFGTSIANVAATISDVKLAPNPNKGVFNISGTIASANDVNVTMEVTNMLGQVVYTGHATAKNGVLNEQLQLGSVAGGMYILSISAGTEKSVTRFVVEK